MRGVIICFVYGCLWQSACVGIKILLYCRDVDCFAKHNKGVDVVKRTFAHKHQNLLEVIANAAKSRVDKIFIFFFLWIPVSVNVPASTFAFMIFNQMESDSSSCILQKWYPVTGSVRFHKIFTMSSASGRFRGWRFVNWHPITAA